MMTTFRLLVCSVALGAIPIALTGCGAGPNSAIPGSVSAEAFHGLGGGAYRTIYAFRNIHRDGTGPNGPLVTINGLLYGTTYFGGRGVLGNGTVFSLTMSGREHVLYRFKGGSDGDNPNSGLVAIDGVLYGTTNDGGRGCGQEPGCGTVFAITPSGREHVVYRFKGGSDGIFPSGSLVWSTAGSMVRRPAGELRAPPAEAVRKPAAAPSFRSTLPETNACSIVFAATVTARVLTPRCSRWTENSTGRHTPAAWQAAAIITAVRSSKSRRQGSKRCSIGSLPAATEATRRRG